MSTDDDSSVGVVVKYGLGILVTCGFERTRIGGPGGGGGGSGGGGG